MEINSILFNNDIPIRYYYCSTESKEYILTGQIDGYIFDSDNSYAIGDIIVSIITKQDFITSIIEKYINIIKYDKYNNNEITNQHIIWNNLIKMQKELLDLNLSVLRYVDFPTDISNKFIEKLSDLNIEKEKYNSKNNNLLQLKDLLNIDKFPENQASLDFLSKQLNNIKENSELLEDLQFKDFTIDYLNNFLLDFSSCIFNFILYFFEDRNLKIKYGNKRFNLSNDLEVKSLLLTNYNNVSTNKIISWTKMGIVNNGKIYVESDTIKKYASIDIKMLHIFEFNNLIDLFNLLLINAIDKKVTIKQCKNCMNFFIPQSRTDEVYCNRISPQNSNKTCKEYGAKKTYRDEIKSTPIKYQHNKTSQFYRMRINRAKTQKEKVLYEKKFTNYKERYQKKKEQYKSGKLKEDVFVKWIEKQKELK